MAFAWEILLTSIVCLVLTLWHVARKGGFMVAVPAIVFFVLAIALYSARIIDAQDGVLSAVLYNNLSNALRLYSCFAFLAYARLLHK